MSARRRSANTEPVTPPRLDGSAGVYLFVGQELFLRRLYLARLIRSAVGEGDDARMAVSEFDGGEAKLSAVLDELRTLPFLAARRVVVVQDAESFVTEHRGALETYAAGPCPTGVLALLVDTERSNSKLYKMVATAGGLVACQRLSQSDLGEWIRGRAREAYDKAIDRETAGLLADLVGENLTRLDSELAKLATYLGDERKTITADDVDELVANQRMHDAFELTGAIAAADARAALVRWEDMLSKDRSVEFSGVALIGWQLRQLLRARLLRRGGLSRDEVYRRLRLPFHVRERFAEQVNRFPERRLRGLIRELVAVDLAAKTGGAPAARGVEQFIVSACRR